MEIVPIFDNRLYALQVKGESKDELSRLLDLWDDTEYLYEFYEKNKKYFKDDYFTVDRNKYEYTEFDFLDDVIYNLEKLEEELLKVKDTPDVSLNDFFIDLSEKKSECKIYELYKKKRNILRLYAIKIDDNLFLIIGGAIKIVEKMQDHPDTKQALISLDYYSQLLKHENIKNLKQLQSYINFKNENK